MERAAGYATIVMNDSFDTEDELRAFANNIGEWMNSYTRNKAKGFHIIIFDKEEYKNLDLSNYGEAYMQLKDKMSIECSINTDGDVSFFK